MLEFAGRKTNRPDPPTKFKLFERENLTGPSHPIPEGTAPSRSRKTPRVNDDGDEHHGNSSTLNTVAQLPPLLSNEALALAVSQVQVPILDGWEPLHIFKLFVVLVEPPPGLDLNAIEGLPDYLTQLKVKIRNLIENGTRMIASRCWCALLGKCSTLDIPWVWFSHLYSALQHGQRGAQAGRLGSYLKNAPEIAKAPDKLVPVNKLSY